MENINQRKLRVLEIGPGTGSFADSLLDFMKNLSIIHDIYLYKLLMHFLYSLYFIPALM